MLNTGLRPDLPDVERVKLYSGHSLRAGLASGTEVDERYVQKQMGHASAEMTRRYQRWRDRFRGNLTKAAGLQLFNFVSDIDSQLPLSALLNAPN